MNRMNPLPTLLCAALLACAGMTSIGTASAQTPPPPHRQAQNAPQPPEWERLSSAQRDAIIAVVREARLPNPLASSAWYRADRSSHENEPSCPKAIADRK